MNDTTKGEMISLLIGVVIMFVVIWLAIKYAPELPEPKNCLEYRQVEYLDSGSSVNVPIWLATNNLALGVAMAEKPHMATRSECIKWEE